MRSKKIELLSPVGSFEKLKWACLYGADAVYLGGTEYSLRANAKNFTLSEISSAVEYAHEHGVKVYVTVNIVFHNEDLIGLKSYLKELENIGVDAIIFSDPAVIEIVRENNINIELHLSTQGCTLNKDACNYFVKQGVSRIVLARECSKIDIKDIIDSVSCEIEVFMHGAMCSNLSGRCVLSNYFTNRDANRGGCAQVCRFNFNLYDLNNNKISQENNFTLSPKDLCMANYLKEMIDIGITSFKLEGRMRSIYYIATIVSVYRRLIDMYLSEQIDTDLIEKSIKILNRCANREVAPQFFNKPAGVDEQYYGNRQEDSNQDFLGIVLSYDESKKEAVIEQRNHFKIGDKVNIFTPDNQDFSFTIEKIISSEGIMLDAARHPREIVKINCDFNVNKDSLMRIDFLSK